MIRSTLRLIHSHNSTNDLLFRANAHLASQEPEKALSLYTKVLYETSPGHLPALLNRSLAYIALGYPELATVDAYRAAVSADAIRGDPSIIAHPRFQAAAKYFRAEKLHKESGAVWTSPPGCSAGSGWLTSPLASIFLGMEISSDDKDNNALCNGLELRALYRLMGALWECGSGAVREALDMLSDVCKRYNLTTMERHWFYELGNQMLDEISIMLESDKSPYNSQGGSKDRYWNDLENRTTMVTREVYPWNNFEPNYRDEDAVKVLQEYTDIFAQPCMAEFYQFSADEAPTVGLAAARDIYPGEVALTESSIIQVSTESTGWSEKYFCDGCGASLILPNEYLHSIYSRPRGWSPLATSSASLSTHKNTSDDDSQSETDVPIFSQQQKKDPDSFPSPPRSPRTPNPPAPPPHRAQTKEPEFRLCPSCGEVAFCTAECEVQSSAFHNPLCTTWTESELREGYRNKGPNGNTSVHPKLHCIHDLLFVRLIAIALESNSHPLAVSEVRYLNGGLWPRPIPPSSPPAADPNPSDPYGSPTPPPQRSENRKSLPWSFESHVLRPLRYLARIGIDPHYSFEDLEKWDGWVINTLYAKIECSVRVTRGARVWKRYDAGGEVVAEGAMREGVEAGKGEEKREDEEQKGGDGKGEGGEKEESRAGNEVWIGSLHTVLSMVGVASEERGERANVAIREGGKVECVALSPIPSDSDPVDTPMESNAVGHHDIEINPANPATTNPPIPTVPQHHPAIEAAHADTPMLLEEEDQESATPRPAPITTTPVHAIEEEEGEVDFIPDSPLLDRGRPAIRVGERILCSGRVDAEGGAGESGEMEEGVAGREGLVEGEETLLEGGDRDDIDGVEMLDV